MLERIAASKLYKTSHRKASIQAAILSPTNLSLVAQLADSLDEKYKTRENLGLPPKESDKAAELELSDELIVDEDIDPESDLVTVDDMAAGLHSSPSTDNASPSRPSEMSEKPEPADRPAADTSELMPESPANEQPQPEETAASTKITATTESDIAVLKGSLNANAETSGVARIALKEGEVWIYYNDDINLNNIMTDVIEHIANLGYVDLEFNRLARSDNAMVFCGLVQTNPESADEDK